MSAATGSTGGSPLSLYVVGLCVIVGAVYAVLRALRARGGKRGGRWLPEETTFYDPLRNQEVRFPATLYDAPTVTLSVIVPAMDEEKRLPLMVRPALEFLKKKRRESPSFSFEVIIVDDGSRDRTTEVGWEYSKQEGPDVVRVLKLFRNHGKGGAIKRGMMYARGEYVLFADADGATKFEDLARLLALAPRPQEHGVVLGSRAHLEDQQVTRKLHRTVLMWGFYMLRAVLCVRGVRDTQCGFKLFTRPTARLLFPNLHIQRWAFDVELLYMAVSHGIPVKEVAVTWREIDGSKLSPLASSLQMARDLLRIRLMYLCGLWTMDN